MILGDSALIELVDFPPSLQPAARAIAPTPEFEQSVSSAKRESITRAWVESNGDYRQAAVLLGLHPNSLLRLIRKLDMRSELRS